MTIDIEELRAAVEAAGLNAISTQEVLELLDRLEAAEKSDAESIAMYRKARDERDTLRAELSKQQALTDAAQHIAEVAQSRANRLRAKVEGVEDERMIDERRIADLMADLNRVGHENDALRAKVEQMERQEPVAWMLNCPTLGGDTGWILSWTQSGAGLCNRLQGEENEKRLYAHPCAQPAPSMPDLLESLRCACNYIDKLGGVSQQYRAALASPEANPAPSEQDESVRKSWARFSHELHRSPDAPYPGMSDAFEQHFSQSFTDREWRAEASTWAAAWKAAKRHCAQPALSVPEGWQLVPTAESRHPGIYKMLSALHAADNTPGMSEWESYRAMLSEAPEVKP